MPFNVFYSLFALFEMLIGALFLIKGWERVAIYLLVLHIVTTILPLFLLPNLAWQKFLVPTLEGQYIIKNILIIIFLIVSLAFTYSRSSYIAFFVGLLVTAYQKKFLKMALLLSACFMLLIFLLPTARNHSIELTRTLDRKSTRLNSSH